MPKSKRDEIIKDGNLERKTKNFYKTKYVVLKRNVISIYESKKQMERNAEFLDLREIELIEPGKE